MNNLLKDLLSSLSTYFNHFVIFLPKIIVALIVFICFFWVASRVKKFANRRLTESMDDPLLATFLSRVIKIGMVLFAFLIALQVLGLASMAAGLITGASVSAIIIGFAFKDIGENFLAGIMLAFNRPFKVGDIVELDGYKGVVNALNLRNSRIKTFDGKDIFIPNADVVKNPVVNYTMDGFLRYDFSIKIDNKSDLNEAIKITSNVIKQIPGVELKEKSITVAIENLEDNTIKLTAYYWLNTFDKTISSIAIKNQAIEKVMAGLDNAGFYLPYNVMELKSYNREGLKTI